MEKKAYRVSEVAEQLGVSQRTCWRLIKEGKLKAQPLDKDSRIRLVTNKSLDDFLSQKAK